MLLSEFPSKLVLTLTGILVHLSVVYAETAEYRKCFKYRYIAVREGVPSILQNKTKVTN